MPFFSGSLLNMRLIAVFFQKARDAYKNQSGDGLLKS